MTVILTGKIERKGFGFGVWALVTESGETYELRQPPQELCDISGVVTIDALLRDDLMSTAMIGPIVEVRSYQVLED